MTTISLKLPEPLLRDLEEEASRRGVTKSAVIRRSLEGTLRRKPVQKKPSCLEMMGGLVGSFKGPRDLSVNRSHLVKAITDRADRRKNNR
jgi:hypothetical protein